MGRRERTGVLSCLREGLRSFPRERKVAPKERRGFQAGGSRLVRVRHHHIEARPGEGRAVPRHGRAAPSPGPSDGGWRGSPQHSLPGRGRPSRHDALRSEPRGTGVPATADSRRTHTLPACAGAEPPEPRRRRRTASQCLSSEFQNYFVEMCSIMFAFVQGNPIPLRQS